MKILMDTKYRIGILIVSLIATLLIIISHCMLLSDKVEEQIMKNLDDVAGHNRATIEKELQEAQNLIDGIAIQIENNYEKIDAEEEIKEIVAILKSVEELYHFKRMGIVNMQGMAYCTDGYEENVGNSELFRLGKMGISNISGSMEDTIGTCEFINVFSVPLIQKETGKIMAVLFATVRTEEFRDLINVDLYEGKGYSYIIEGDGKVVTDSRQSPMYGYKNIYDAMLEISADNEDIVKVLKTNTEKKMSGSLFFTSDGKRYLHYTPLVIDSAQQTWYLFTIVPAEILEQRKDEILDLNEKMLMIVGIIVIITVLLFIFLRKSDMKLLKRLAYVDEVTGGENYYSFLEKMKLVRGIKGYFVSLDINEFKLVNSACGISKGNETLKEVWNIIGTHMKENELAAHINADHYVMFLMGDSRAEIIERIGNLSKDITELAEKINIIRILPYFGIYETSNLEDPEECYSQANQAKHLVKGNRQKNWAFYEQSDYQRIVEEKRLVDCFDKAIEDCEFEMWYQPKYKSDDKTIVGAEALVRWRMKDGSLMPPLRFIPLFERTGLIATLDEYVFRMVCMQQKKWEKEGRSLFPISVNISRASLYYENVVQKYEKILQECDIKPDLVPLEITESATVDNSQIRILVENFRKIGFPMHLDDFGNGYSSLATLNMMHFDTLKLDKGLVDFVGDNNGEKLLTYTIKLAKSLGMKITAEGVETLEQVSFLRNHNCDEIQGYYFSKPLPLDKFEELIGELCI